MDTDEIEQLIEDGIEDAQASVRPARGATEDGHFAARVVAPAFEGESLVDRHQLVYDALGEHMTTDIHAIEIETVTPAEAE